MMVMAKSELLRKAQNPLVLNHMIVFKSCDVWSVSDYRSVLDQLWFCALGQKKCFLKKLIKDDKPYVMELTTFAAKLIFKWDRNEGCAKNNEEQKFNWQEFNKKSTLIWAPA
uniref:Uncharacterized protein n=1 Tax=Rhizophagus irregularis (strain DAOM 181602 / DAOM 197198 / MUCL 43194) TaxID=747089 RepID=U9SYM3_RHIID